MFSIFYDLTDTSSSKKENPLLEYKLPVSYKLFIQKCCWHQFILVRLQFKS